MAKRKTKSNELSASDYEPLLVAISSRAVDTCLQGARCLALLEDPRAFGLLMQLSREENPDVRLETCRSLAQLADRRATDRLCTLLVDPEVKVRDAAFTALSKICTDDPLVAAENGLAASFEDIRRRGLEVLVRVAKKSKKANEDVHRLLRQALNDPAESIRNEAFKFALNSKFDGGDEKTLRFLLGSSHADVRREVLNETMAEENQEWAQTLILELLSDPNKGVRSDAFSFLKQKYEKKTTIDWLSAAIASDHVDIRKSACQSLIKNGTDPALDILAAAIHDDDEDIRQLVLKSLIQQGSTDALVACLDSQHVGIRLSAAIALAKNGDQRAKPILLGVAQKPWPEDGAEPSAEQQSHWVKNVDNALEGLSYLPSSELIPVLIDLTKCKSAEIRAQAADGLLWSMTSDSLDLIKPLLIHEDPKICLPATFAAGMNGDLVSARAILNSPPEAGKLIDRLYLAAALGDETENQLVQLLDVENRNYANIALLILLCRDWLDHDGTPRRIISALAARDARLRLIAASALQAFGDTDKMHAVIVDLFNNRADDEDFKIEPEVIQTVAAMMTFAGSPFLCRVISLLECLDETKQNAWDAGWKWLTKRYDAEVNASLEEASNKKLPKLTTTEETLDQLAFGTYVGLAREQGGFHFEMGYTRFGWSIVHVRSEALRRLLALAKADDQFLDPSISVVTHTCGDPRTEVRKKAFETLKELGVDDQRRAEIGIGCGRLDLAVSGLELLTHSATAKTRNEILKQAILEQPADVALEAAKMLNEHAGSVETCKVCLESPNLQLAVHSVSWVAEDYTSKPAAKKLLQSLATDSVRSVRARALGALIKHSDDKAFDAIAEILGDPNPVVERRVCYRWLTELGDEKTPQLLLKLLDDHELGVDADPLLNTVASFRDVDSVAPLLELMEKKEYVGSAVKAVVMISGFDQRIVDPQDLQPDRSWMEGQHPRHGDVLAKLLDRCVELNYGKPLVSLIGSARWCLTNEVDDSIGRLVNYPEDSIRHAAIAAISFRAEKREGSVDSLETALEHRDPTTQFLAAEGLAKGGRDDGFQILMSAIEMMDDLRMRQRAVLALGHLADERTLDMLLKLVTFEGHALQASAAEAIGRLGQSEHSGKILKILKQLIDDETSAGERALIGLRYMDSSEGWDVVRACVKKNRFDSLWQSAVKQLGYDQSPATQDLLIDRLKRFPGEPDETLLSARRSFGTESVAPDIACLEGKRANQYQLSTVESECVKRICDRADPEQLFEVVSGCPYEAAQTLTSHILLLDPLPIKAAAVAIESSKAVSVTLAAQVIGRNADKKHSSSVGASLDRWLETYSKTSEELRLQNEQGDVDFVREREAIQKLVWAAGRVGGLEKNLLNIVTTQSSGEHFGDLRVAAMESLKSGKISAALKKQIKLLHADYDSRIRLSATEILASEMTKTEMDALAETVLADRHCYNVLTREPKADLTKTFQTAAESAHYQPRSIPQLTNAHDVKTLLKIASNSKSELNVRLGAIEGLAAMDHKDAEKNLVTIGKDESIDEDLRKAAWRGLRRWKRRTLKQAARPGKAGQK